VLRNINDEIARFSYALALKREGRYNEALGIYSTLIDKSPNARVYNNIANCYVARNDMARAKKFYEKSIELRPTVVSLYNLSQVSRRTRDYTKGEGYFLSAQKLSPGAVSRFQTLWSWNPNRFVVDEVLPLPVLLSYAMHNPMGVSSIGLSALPLSVTPVFALVLIILFYVLDRSIESRAYRCKKCGVIFCNMCEKHLPWGRMCPKCFGSLVKLDGLDPRERIARLQETYSYQVRRRSIVKTFSLLLPGSAYIYGGDVLKGFLLLWYFLFLLSLIPVGSLFAERILQFPHLWLNVVAVLIIGIVYAISIITVRRRLAKRWL